jgi:hypothetical protein
MRKNSFLTSDRIKPLIVPALCMSQIAVAPANATGEISQIVSNIEPMNSAFPGNGASNSDDELVEYLEDAPQPLPPRDPIGPPDVQPGEAPIKSDE